MVITTYTLSSTPMSSSTEDAELFFFSSRRRHTRSKRDRSSDVCSSDLTATAVREGKRPDRVRFGYAPENDTENQRDHKAQQASLHASSEFTRLGDATSTWTCAINIPNP